MRRSTVAALTVAVVVAAGVTACMVALAQQAFERDAATSSLDVTARPARLPADTVDQRWSLDAGVPPDVLGSPLWSAWFVAAGGAAATMLLIVDPSRRSAAVDPSDACHDHRSDLQVGAQRQPLSGVDDAHDRWIAMAGGPVVDIQGEPTRDDGDDARTTAPAPTPDTTDDHAPRVLVVEDNPINQEVARELLLALGYAVDVVHDGAQGVDAVRDGSYAAVLMDCQMPTMDGYEATARIREHEAGIDRHTPIIAVTASAMIGDRQRCLAAGMDDYIAKPVTTHVLSATVARWVYGRGAPSGDGGPAAPAAIRPPVVDWEILHQLQVVPGLLDRSRDTFLRNGAREIADIRRACADGDLVAASRLAHKLKGASLTIGASRLGEQLQQVEHACAESPNDVLPLLDGVDQQFAAAREALTTTVEPA